MWNLKCTVVPVITGVIEIVTRSLRKHLEAVPGKHSIDSLQKTAILGTAHIIRKVLQCEAWSVSGGDHCWFERSTGKKCLWHPYRIVIIIIIINVCYVFLGISKTHCKQNFIQIQWNANLKLPQRWDWCLIVWRLKLQLRQRSTTFRRNVLFNIPDFMCSWILHCCMWNPHATSERRE